MRKCHPERLWTLVPLWLAVCVMTVAQGSRAQAGRGLAARHPHDRQIESDPSVIVAADFESDTWRQDFSGANRPTVSVVADDEERAFRPLLGKALRIEVPQGEHYGASIEYDFKKRLGYEPEEIYFRYYLRLGGDWDPARGGKLPGIGGTYGRGGWGGRPSDGRNGWSARGQFNGQKNGKTPIGFYCYHADMKGRYGSSWIWENDGLGYLENSRWYCVEQYARLNTPGENDGVLRGWVDGKLAFERTDIRMRDIPDLKIESIWINVYHGGTWSAPSDDHLFIDNVVIAKQYIGPMSHEADVVVSPPEPYRVAYSAMCPKKGECENLLVPVCLSSSHIAYGSIRMEPVFMILGQSAATAAVQAIDANGAVQDVDYDGLRDRLVKEDQRL